MTMLWFKTLKSHTSILVEIVCEVVQVQVSDQVCFQAPDVVVLKVSIVDEVLRERFWGALFCPVSHVNVQC